MANTDLNKKCRKMQLTINNPHKETTTPCGRGFCTVKNVIDYIENSGLIKNDYYCFSFEIGLKENTPHIHIFFCFKSPRYGKVIKEKFPTAHIEFCNGSNIENRDYIFKTGKWEGDKKEGTRVDGMQYENMEIPPEKGKGKRTDLEAIKDLVDSGLTPRQILDINPNFYRNDKYIGEMYYSKRLKETPIKRDVDVVVHCGVAGSGKTNMLTKMDEERVYIGVDYSSALFDDYEGEEILFLDEFRGQIAYNQLLIILDGYKMPVHARYYNKYSLWDSVHITSVIPMEDWYNNDNIRDTFEQLKRRVSYITYHFITDSNNVFIADKTEYKKNHDESGIRYYEYTIHAEQYTTYEDLEREALASVGALVPIECDDNDLDFISENSMEKEFEVWKQGTDLFDTLSDEDLFNMFWNYKVQKSKEAVA